MSSGKEFFQELFEKRPISSIIPQRPRLETIIMMKRKGKTLVQEKVEKPIKNKPMSKVKESQKMLLWMKMDSSKLKGVKWAGLESLFNLQWTMTREDLLRDFLWTWEAIKDGRILWWVCGQEILIDQVLIHEQLGTSKEGVIDATNVTFEEAQNHFKKNYRSTCFCWEWVKSVVHMKEEFYARFVAILQILYQKERLAYFSNRIAITFDLANKGQLVN